MKRYVFSIAALVGAILTATGTAFVQGGSATKPPPPPTTSPSRTQPKRTTTRPTSRPTSRSTPQAPKFSPTDPQIELVLIPAGTFMMGSPDGVGESNEHPQHQVTVQGFYMGKFEVTQAQYRALMGEGSSYFKGDELPVEQVSWEEAGEFCRRLSQMKGREYRLPTEAEEEYACRAGMTGDYAGDLNAMAWYSSNSGGKTHPVGQKQPNAFGLYDMHGNVWEWCLDYYHSSYIGAPIDGSAWTALSNAGAKWDVNHVLRGGSWDTSANNLRSAYRTRYDLVSGYNLMGFRVVASTR